MTEIWKPVVGYEGQYDVSSHGRIRSLVSQKVRPFLIRTPRSRKDGYLDMCLKVNQKVKCFLVHVLVAEAFISGKQAGSEVNHIDGNKTNNRIDNLEWNTHRENIIHANKTGLRKPPSPEAHRFSVLRTTDVIEIRRRLKGKYNGRRFDRGSLQELAVLYRVAPQTISNAARGISWSQVQAESASEWGVVFDAR